MKEISKQIEQDRHISRQMRLMRHMRHSKSNITRLWPRRSGKSYILKKLAKVKGSQYINIKPVVIEKNTRVLLLDDYTKEQLKNIKKSHPYLRLIAIGTPNCN